MNLRKCSAFAILALTGELLGCSGKVEPKSTIHIDLSKYVSDSDTSDWTNRQLSHTLTRIGPDSAEFGIDWTTTRDAHHQYILSADISIPQHPANTTYGPVTHDPPQFSGPRDSLIENITIKIPWGRNPVGRTQSGIGLIILQGNGKVLPE